MESDLLRGHLDGLLLTVLSHRPGHGYDLSRRLTEGSGGELHVPEGSLYPALARLERQGLVVSDWEAVDGRRRRIYRLAPSGRTAADRAGESWRRFAAAMNRIMGETA